MLQNTQSEDLYYVLHNERWELQGQISRLYRAYYDLLTLKQFQEQMFNHNLPKTKSKKVIALYNQIRDLCAQAAAYTEAMEKL